MKKQILALSVCALLALPLSAQADWMTAPENRFYTEGGTIAARISLTSEQSLRLSVAPEEGTASFYFLYGDQADEDAFALQLPCLIQNGGTAPSALVSVIPVIDTGNGSRGAPAGGLIVSYKDGGYKTAFDAASVEGDWTEASIEVQKKDLVLHLKDAAGTMQSYLLKYDKKSGTFSTEDAVSGSTVIIER